MQWVIYISLSQAQPIKNAVATFKLLPSVGVGTGDLISRGVVLLHITKVTVMHGNLKCNHHILQ